MSYTSLEVYEYISKQTNDPIVERKTCTVSGQKFAVYQSDLDFYDKISPTFAGQKFQIPTPTLCPEERQRRRLSFRNERKLYKRKCDATGDTIISIYSPDKPYKVYKQDFWRSDNWDAMSFYISHNHNRSFFEQFDELNIIVPKRALVKGTGSENCDYVNGVGASRNCYFIFDSNDNSDCCFSNTIISCDNCYDTSIVKTSKYCYELIDCINCYAVTYAQSSTNCKYSHFLLECNNCEFCFACVGLNNKKYCIFNKQYSQEIYEQEVKKVSGHYNRTKFGEFTKTFPLLANKSINCERNRGNMVYNSLD